jgi:hypothetical protein
MPMSRSDRVSDAGLRARWFWFQRCGNGHLMSPAKNRAEVLDPEQEDDEQPEPELPPQEEPLTAPEPETLPPDPDLAPPGE